MKCCRCGNDTTTGDPGETLCVGCYEVYKATYPPTPDPIDQFTAPYPHNRICATEAYELARHTIPSPLTDEEVWLRAWEAAAPATGTLTMKSTVVSTESKCRITTNEFTDGTVWRADACLAAFRERFRQEDAETT